MPARRSLALLATLLPLAAHAGGHDGHRGLRISGDCRIEKGPNDLVSKGAPLVVPEDARAESVVAIAGDVVVKRGAVVKNVAAIGGDVRIEAGAVVRESVAAIGGDLTVAKGAKIGEDAVALGGHLDAREGSEIGGGRLGLDVSFAGIDLKAKILEEVHAEGCTIELEE